MATAAAVGEPQRAADRTDRGLMAGEAGEPRATAVGEMRAAAMGRRETDIAAAADAGERAFASGDCADSAAAEMPLKEKEG